MSQTPSPPAIDPYFLALLDSNRISERTRRIMKERAQTHDLGYRPCNLSEKAFDVLAALTPTILPQEALISGASLNLAARIDARLSTAGDGWRFAILPPDLEAYERALTGLESVARTQHKTSFVALEDQQKYAMIHAMGTGQLATETLDAAQMQAWFSDLRADCVQIFFSHPATLAQLGIDAIFNGGDELFQGFSAMGEGVSESWEPHVKTTGQ